MATVGADYEAVVDEARMLLAEGGFDKGGSSGSGFLRASLVMAEAGVAAEAKVPREVRR